MSIRMMCQDNAEGAYCDLYWTKDCSRDGKIVPIVLNETHVGLVLETREVNGRDDSDFYAIVWSPEKGTTERVDYASTRGWTYPNGANVDATPEVRAAYEAFCREREDKARKEREDLVARTPAKGKRVRVVKGRKIPVGTEGEIVWMGPDKFHRDYYSRYAPTLAQFGIYDIHEKVRGMRVGIKITEGNTVFTSADNVEVVL